MTNEANPPDPRDEEYAKKLRAARIRAAIAAAATLAFAAVIYECSVTDGGLPVASCKEDRNCAGTQNDPVCVAAPTGPYCSRKCSADDDCNPGFVCNVPSWTPGKTDRLCLHDSQHIGQ